MVEGFISCCLVVGVIWFLLTIGQIWEAGERASLMSDLEHAPARWARMQDEQDMLESFRASRQVRRKSSKKAKKKKETIIDVECIDTDSYPVQKR